MHVKVETIPAEQVIRPEDQAAAEFAGLAPSDVEALYETTAHHFPDTTLEGTDRVVHSLRTHTGPEGPWRGGTKLKPYDRYEDPKAAVTADCVNHSAPMSRKFLVYGVEAGGGKTASDVPYEASDAQKVAVLRHIARSCVEAGIAVPGVMVTAGDEGTNGLLAEYRQAFAEAQAEDPELLVMGAGFPARGPATGRASIMYMREQMRLENIDSARFVSVGAGAAGGHAIADACDPIYEVDSDRKIIVPAFGDLRRNFSKFEPGKQGAVLYTPDRSGLHVTQEMFRQAQDAEDPDRKAEEGWLMGALARKLERDGQDIRIADGADALTYDDGLGNPDSYFMAPAATSNMIHKGNIGDIVAGRILEIGNSTVVRGLMSVLIARGKRFMSGDAVNAGGAFMSVIQSGFEIERQMTESMGGTLPPQPERVYDEMLRQKVNQVTNQIHRLRVEFGLEDHMATNVLATVNAANRFGMPARKDIQQVIQSVPVSVG